MKKIAALVLCWLWAGLVVAMPDFAVLEGTDWQQEGSSSDRYTLHFDVSEDGTYLMFGGKAACNRYFGSVIQEQGQPLTVGPIGSTLMPCSAEQPEENEFLAIIYQTVDMQLSGDQLILLDKNGAVLTKFNKK